MRPSTVQPSSRSPGWSSVPFKSDDGFVPQQGRGREIAGVLPALGKGHLEYQRARVGLELEIPRLLRTGLQEQLEDVAIPEGVVPLGCRTSGARRQSSSRRSRGHRHPRPGRRTSPCEPSWGRSSTPRSGRSPRRSASTGHRACRRAPGAVRPIGRPPVWSRPSHRPVQVDDFAFSFLEAPRSDAAQAPVAERQERCHRQTEQHENHASRQDHGRSTSSRAKPSINCTS